MDINELLEIAVQRGASDLHLKVGTQPILRIDGNLQPIADKRKVTQEDTAAISAKIMTLRQKKLFKENHEVDLAYSIPGLGRFRVNIFQQRGTIGMVFRAIQTVIKTFEELNLPPVLAKIAMEPRGLVLVTGATGTGKSTTLASMIDYINRHKTVHIVTIEDPIEFLHRDKKSIINQREIGTDANEFYTALRSALRQDPDIILVGEMRDYETTRTALMAAETGHLVFSTLHTIDALETINRVIAIFPPHEQDQVRYQLASVLKGVISQRLIPRKDGNGRIPACEILVSTALVRDCIINKQKTHLIYEAMRQGVSQYGMQTFDQALTFLVKKNLIKYEDALKYSSSPEDFALRFRGIESAGDTSLSEMETEISLGSKHDQLGDEEDDGIIRFTK